MDTRGFSDCRFVCARFNEQHRFRLRNSGARRFPGLQVAYPGEWSVVQDPVIESSVSFANPNDLSESLRIYAVAPDAEGLIREALASFSAKAIKIGGQPGVMYKNTGIDGTTSKVALVNFDGKLYYIGGNSADFEELLEQVSFFNN